MPVILNLIKESLKPVTQEAEGGRAIAPFLAIFLHFWIHISRPIGALFLVQEPGSEGKSVAARFLCVQTSFKTKK